MATNMVLSSRSVTYSMVEGLVQSDPPKYDMLERKAAEYQMALRRNTRPYSFLLFFFPVLLIIIWLFFIESPLILVLSVAAYIALIVFTVYARFRADTGYRELSVKFGYYLIHSDYSVYTMKTAVVVLAVLLFIMIDSLRGINQSDFFILILVFIVAYFFVNVFSPRFMRYNRMAADISSPIASALSKISSSVDMPPYTVRVVKEKKMKVANAYCTGFLRNRIYVTDYLLENLKDDEAIVILAHELGHVFYRHNLKTLMLTFLLLFASAILFFSFLFLPISEYTALTTQGGVLLFILGIPVIVPAVKRGYELQADMFASRFKSEDDSVNALKKTSYLNMTPLGSSGSLTHPPMYMRLDRIRKAIKMRDLKDVS